MGERFLLLRAKRDSWGSVGQPEAQRATKVCRALCNRLAEGLSLSPCPPAQAVVGGGTQLEVRETQVQIPALPLTGCVTSGSPFRSLCLNFPTCGMGVIIDYFNEDSLLPPPTSLQLGPVPFAWKRPCPETGGWMKWKPFDP